MNLVANEEAINSFRKEYYEKKLSHAFIIEGARGSGRLTLARALASILTCEGESAPCDRCTGCRRVTLGTHPDVQEILHKDRTSQIKIDEIRDIIAEAHIKPSEAEYKVFIIENAQMMNDAAQNALLQIFEEPPQNTVFFLLTTDKNYLLKTLLSRARVIKTQPLTDEQVEKILSEKFPDKKDLIPHAVVLANGCAGAAIEVLEGENSPEMLRAAQEYLTLASNGSTLYSLSKVLSPFKKTERDEFSSFCSYVITALRDAACLGVGCGEKRMFFSNPEVPAKLFERFGLERILKACDAVEKLLRRSGSVGMTTAICYLNTFFASDFK